MIDKFYGSLPSNLLQIKGNMWEVIMTEIKNGQTFDTVMNIKTKEKKTVERFVLLSYIENK